MFITYNTSYSEKFVNPYWRKEVYAFVDIIYNISAKSMVIDTFLNKEGLGILKERTNKILSQKN